LSWFGNLVETYSRLADIVGIPDEKGNILLPPGHMAANTDVCVTINGEGKFLRAGESKENIVIPCTEDSSSRAGKVEYPHPLHEQIGYISLDKKKRAAYLAQLEEWGPYHNKVEAVFRYVSGGSLINDLQTCDIKTDDPKLFVRFSVETSLEDLNPNLWKDETVSAAWQSFCDQTEAEDTTLCYATGNYAISRSKHPKGVNPSANSAKLISCNDSTNYTYRGRFAQPEQANAISALASHQAHAVLRYLIATQGHKCDSQAIVAWAVDDGSAAPDLLGDSLGLYSVAQQTDLEKVIQAQGEVVDMDFAKKLRNALSGRGNAAELRSRNRHIAVIAIDAATTGRMAITFYKDLLENEYIDRVIAWHESCCWWFRGKGVDYVSAPSADRIIAAVYGEPKGENYDKIKKQGRERLLHCILNGERVDTGWLCAAVNRVSNPFSYSKQDGGWDMYRWATAVSVTCALARKHYTDRKERISLELDKTCSDRSYLYGRLLALAEKIESHARYLQTGGNDTDKRPTNALRYMSAFAVKPFRTWVLICNQLVPYLQRLDGGEWYKQQIDEIMSIFREGEYECEKALDGRYLMGYSLQRRALYTKNDKEETENAEKKD